VSIVAEKQLIFYLYRIAIYMGTSTEALTGAEPATQRIMLQNWSLPWTM
jgi:hypothetical protein